MAGDIAEVERLLAAYSPLIEERDDVCPPNSLHIAAENGDIAMVRSLLNHAADANAATYHMDETRLHLAGERGYANIVKLLIEHGANLEARDDDGYTPLHYASQCGRWAVVEALLSCGAEVNSKTDHGDTPLGSAMRRLRETGSFSDEEIALITDAIALHSTKDQTDGPFAELLKDADVFQGHLCNPGYPVKYSERLNSTLAELGLMSDE